MENELLPCPFCGSDEVNIARVSDGFVGFCEECLCEHGPHGSIITAIEAWNTRVEEEE